jgi:hypothetical protein
MSGDSQAHSPEYKAPCPASQLLALPPPSSASVKPHLQQQEQTRDTSAAESTKEDDDRVAFLERLAAKQDPKGVGKSKGTVMKKPAGEPKAKAKAEPAEDKKCAKRKVNTAEAIVEKPEGILKRPAAAHASAFPLGCAKCRRSPSGCKQCRNPAFTGRRGSA